MVSLIRIYHDFLHYLIFPKLDIYRSFLVPFVVRSFRPVRRFVCSVPFVRFAPVHRLFVSFLLFHSFRSRSSFRSCSSFKYLPIIIFLSLISPSLKYLPLYNPSLKYHLSLMSSSYLPLFNPLLGLVEGAVL